MFRRFLLTLLLAAPLAGLAQNNFSLPPATDSNFSSMIRPAPTYVDARVLAASTSETQTIPTSSRFVVFSATCDFWAKPGSSAAVPAADTSDGSAAELNPSAWSITSSMTQITVISSVVCTVTMAFYK